MFDNFPSRHIGVTDPEELRQMLQTIGVGSVDELIAQVIPQSIRLRKPLDLPAGMSEYEFAAHIRALADRNRPLRSFIGMGYYPCAVPAVVSRNVFENPSWYTSYTPYQAEISQGRLEALLNFQTAILSLTGMEIANCSLLDEGTATAEAMLMMFALRSRDAVKEGRTQLFVDRNLFPQTLDVLLTRSEPFGIELIIDEYDQYEFSGKEFGAILQYPAADGAVRDYAAFVEAAHTHDACRLHGHTRSLQAPDAGAHHRRFGRSAGQPRTAHGAPDARTAHQARTRHLEHLHRLGAHGFDDGLLLRL